MRHDRMRISWKMKVDRYTERVVRNGHTERKDGTFAFFRGVIFLVDILGTF